MKVFVDTNVLLDVLSCREPFHEDAIQIWSLAEAGKLKGLVSAISVANVFYLVRRFKNARAAYEAVRLIRDTFGIVACDERVLGQAMDAGWKDFEDAVQYFSARHAQAACIVSRDGDHFTKSDLPVLSPAEFLAGLLMT